MYFIVGKTINQGKQLLSYIITDGNSIQEVSPQQVYVECQKGNLPYLKGFDTNTGEVDFKNIDNTLIPSFYNGRGISNSVSVLKILKDNDRQIGVRILVASGKIMNVSLSDIIKLVNGKKIQLFNAKVVNNKVVMKYADTTATSRGNDEVTINNYDKSKFIIDDNLTLIKYNGKDEKVIIPKGVTSIEPYAFEGCNSLTSVIIPSSVTDIGDEAFEDCTSLTSIRIPNSVTSIGADAFKRCFMLSSITIPNSVTYIGDSAFYGCDRLTSITIPNSMTYITSNAFVDCISLTSITIPDSVATIYKNAFSGCTGLTSITIPDNVMYLNDNAFRGCTALKSITIPDSVTRIGKNVFYDCPNLCIKGVHGSAVEKYAIDNNIKFEAITK